MSVSGCRRIILLAWIWVIFGVHLGQPEAALALQQLADPTFTVNWNNQSRVVEAFPLSPWIRLSTDGHLSGNCWQGRFEKTAGQPAWPKGDGYIQAKFPYYGRSAPANVLIRHSRREFDVDPFDWTLSMTGTIRDATDTSIIHQTFLNRSIVRTEEDTTWRAYSWTGTLATLATEGQWLRFYWAISCDDNNKGVEERISDIYLDLSPSGLTATESAAGIPLRWAVSRPGPGAACPGLRGTNCYRIYRRTDPAADWGVPIWTGNDTSWTDPDPPIAETLYYTATDLDTNNYESPKSPAAIWKPAHLVIDAVSCAYGTVTIGQTVLVNVTVRNSGYSPLVVDALELVFEGPASATYTVLPPTLPVSLASEAAQTLTYQVKIEEGVSAAGFETISASGTATTAWRGLKVTAPAAVEKQPWTLRNPAALEVIDIAVPARIYRGQIGAPIEITVLNNGGENAAGRWLTSAFEFDPGSSDFSNLRLESIGALPAEISADKWLTLRYLVDVAAEAATGPCFIDSRVRYEDINLRIPLWTNWEASPIASWTVLAGIMRTFRTSSYVTETFSYNQGDFTVYAKAENLQPLTSHRFRFFDPADLEVHTSPTVPTDDKGTATYEYPVTGTPPLGRWRVVATRPLNGTPLAENFFRVVTPASIAVKLSLPPVIVNGRSFNATMTMTSEGGAGVDPAYAGTMVRMAGSVGNATQDATASPSQQAIAGGGIGTFSWRWTATGLGSFTVQAKGYAYDENDATGLETATATSNMAWIRTAPALSVTGVTETYTLVAPGQSNLTVNLTLSNSGEAPVFVTAASLSFSLGTHHQQCASPAVLPYLLNGNTTTTFRFLVAVDEGSVTGAVLGSGSFAATEVHDPTWSYAVQQTGGTNLAWTIGATPYGECSANVGFVPQQYTFNRGQTLYVKFHGVNDGDTDEKVSLLFFDDESAGGVGAQVGDLRGITIGGDATVTGEWQIPANGAIKKWRVAVYDWDKPGQYAEGAPLITQYFWVEQPGNLLATLTVATDPVNLGDTVTVTLSLANEPAGRGVVYPATATLPVKFWASTGAATLVSGPTPASVSVRPGYPATFTWIYQTTAHSGFDTFRMIATASGYDENSTYADPADRMTTVASAVSTGIRIYQRLISFSSATIDLQTMLPGETKVITGFTIDNVGNAPLTDVQWQRVRPANEAGDTIPLESFSLSPTTGFTLGAPGSRAGSFTLTLPYNQASGSYQSVMRVYDDVNHDTQRNVDEPFADFTVTVVASECRLLIASPKVITLGTWPAPSQTSSVTMSILSGGNLDLGDVKVKELSTQATFSTIHLNPAHPGLLVAGSLTDLEVSATIGATEPGGSYIATWVVWDDSNNPNGAVDTGEASATVQVRFEVGVKAFDAWPDPIDLGSGNPDSAINNVPFTLRNSIGGDRAILRPAAVMGPLSHQTDPTYVIDPDNVLLLIPAGPIPVGENRAATLTIFLPAGSLAGDYQGTMTLFDDEDGDGEPAGTANEYETEATVRVTVAPVYSLAVLWTTIDLGGITPPATKSIMFPCMNTGSLDLTRLFWQKIALTPAPTIPVGNYLIEGPATASPGQLFNATLTMTIDATQAFGAYQGEFAYLYDDLGPVGLSATDAQDPFRVRCRIGNFSLDILEAGPLVATGVPSSRSSIAGFSIRNVGTLDLELPKPLAVSPLVDLPPAPDPEIATSATVFDPTLFGTLTPGMTRAGKWAVQIPPGTEVGTYAGVIKVFNDEDQDGSPDALEASDSVAVSLRVLENMSMDANPNSCEMPVTKPGATGIGAVVLQNTGNRVIGATSVTAVKLDLISGGASIPASAISFGAVPANLPYRPLLDSFATVTVSIAVPPTQFKGIYEGTQVVNYDGKTCTFLLRITVGEKKIAVTDPVDLGAGNPGQNLTRTFFLKNESATIPLDSMRWRKAPLSDGGSPAESIATTAFSFAPSGFSVNTGFTQTVTASLTIPAGQAPGVYSAIQTVFDDTNLNQVYDDGEASKTFTVTVTVNPYPKVDILTPSPFFLGDVMAGAMTPGYQVEFKNIGNVPLTLDWLKTEMTPTPGPGAPLTTAEIVFSDPGTIAIGETCSCTVAIAPLATRGAGSYSGTQTLQDNSRVALFPGHVDTLILRCTVTAGMSGPNVGSGSVFQEIATATFPTAPGPPRRFFLSGFVCPGSGSARLGFAEVEADADIASHVFIAIDQAGRVTRQSGIDGGVIEIIPTRHPGFPTESMTWYRVFVSFDYQYDPVVASRTYLILENTSPHTASHSVWFDGVQFEEAVFSDQTRPTAYSAGKKLISPNRSLDLKGDKKFYEW